MKQYLILGGLAVAGLLVGIAARGFSDGKGWTAGTP